MNIVFIIIVAALAWFWWDSLGARETAYQAALRACKIHESIIIDNTVVLKKLWLRRNEKGHIEICRFYYFSFTSDAQNSYQAYVLMQGKRVGKLSFLNNHGDTEDNPNQNPDA